MLRTGSEEWWQTLRGPQCRAVDDAIEVTFWWRDPAGDETRSPHRRVWLYITGVTDHHQNARPQSLQRLPGTDAWFWRTTLSPTWRGSYCFIPSDRDDDFSPEVFSADAPDRAVHVAHEPGIVDQAVLLGEEGSRVRGGRDPARDEHRRDEVGVSRLRQPAHRLG